MTYIWYHGKRGNISVREVNHHLWKLWNEHGWRVEPPYPTDYLPSLRSWLCSLMRTWWHRHAIKHRGQTKYLLRQWFICKESEILNYLITNGMLFVGMGSYGGCIRKLWQSTATFRKMYWVGWLVYSVHSSKSQKVCRFLLYLCR